MIISLSLPNITKILLTHYIKLSTDNIVNVFECYDYIMKRLMIC